MHDLVGTTVGLEASHLQYIDTGDAKPVTKRPYRQSPEISRNCCKNTGSVFIRT